MILSNIIKTLCLGFVITKFTPFQWFLEAISPIFNKNGVTKFIFNIISLLTSCFSCCSFWTGCIMYGFWYGIVGYILAYLYGKLLEHKVEKVRFQ
jgi:hypothetical protein